MQYTTLGRTALKVSRLCLGTMNFGPETPEPLCHAMMDKALEVGINFFDTANVYGGKKGEGITEQIIGRWLAQGGRRERLVLATKVHNGMGDRPNERGLSAWHIRAACDASLKRLQTDRIDLYQMHHVDRTAPWDEIWQAMDQLVQAGKVIYVGSSNFAGWHIATANQEASKRHSLGLVSEQSKYSLACRTPELEVLPACRHYGMGVIPWSPLEGGLLAGVLAKQADASRRVNEWASKEVEKLRPRLTLWEDFCRQVGSSPADVGLAWVLSNPLVTAPIIGPRTMEQLTGCLGALDLRLDESARKRIDEIWPGPGGEAPEAYAW